MGIWRECVCWGCWKEGPFQDLGTCCWYHLNDCCRCSAFYCDDCLHLYMYEYPDDTICTNMYVCM
jgi:hypothetical protein